jgi:predicted transcriptional regulator
MGIQVMNAVWRNSKASGRQKLVLLAIADHQGELGAWPSIKTISTMANASERSVQRDIQQLVELGELIVETRSAPTQGQYKANRYWVSLKDSPEVTDSAAEVTERASEVTELAPEVTAGGVLTLNRTLNRNLNETLVSQFESFWNNYPRKTDKGSARKAYKQAVTKADPEHINLKAKEYGDDPNLPDKKYIKHPATWLNAESWDNGPLPTRANRAEQNRKAMEEFLNDQS